MGSEVVSFRKCRSRVQKIGRTRNTFSKPHHREERRRAPHHLARAQSIFEKERQSKAEPKTYSLNSSNFGQCTNVQVRDEEDYKTRIGRSIYTPRRRANPIIVDGRRQRKIMRHACADFGTCFGSFGDFGRGGKTQISMVAAGILNGMMRGVEMHSSRLISDAASRRYTHDFWKWDSGREDMKSS
jgi:hypothetical protein